MTRDEGPATIYLSITPQETSDLYSILECVVSDGGTFAPFAVDLITEIDEAARTRKRLQITLDAANIHSDTGEECE